MFTGIIETIGDVRQILSKGGQMQLVVGLGRAGEGIRAGDSIAVNGVCLTACRVEGGCAAFDVSSETLDRSNLGRLKPGAKVNLEGAMSAQGRFGGHIVQGHVDGMAMLTNIRKRGDFAEFRFEAPAELLSQMVLKGSVAVDGISVTVAQLDATGFEVAVIPTTLKETTWQTARVGDVVNIETDILVKIVKKQLSAILPQQGLTLEKLKDHGF
ncbi:MAG: riboflavin synthase [Planctomycetales bacterium]|nr:riboflavin synthase [Planctomycetales bacterium]